MEIMENEQNYKGFAAIRDKAVEIGMPKYWATDLGIDAMSLWEHKDTLKMLLKQVRQTFYRSL